MSTRNQPEPDEPDPADVEYDFSHGVRGKYAHRFEPRTVTVRLDPDVARVFPDATAVNDALRRLIRRSQNAAERKSR
jgi:hypothetical protein